MSSPHPSFLLALSFFFIHPSLSDVLPCNIYTTTNYLLKSDLNVESYENINFGRVFNYADTLQKLSIWSIVMFPGTDSVTAKVPLSQFPRYQAFLHDEPDFTLKSSCSNHFVLFHKNVTVCGSSKGYLVFDLHCHHYFKSITNLAGKKPIVLSFFQPNNHRDTLYMLTTKTDGEFAFIEYSDGHDRKCNLHPSSLVVNTVNDVFSTARNLFEYIETFLTAYFSLDNCHTHEINFGPMKLTPSLLTSLQSILNTHPFTAAFLLSRSFLSENIICYYLKHNNQTRIAVNEAQIHSLFNVMQIFDIHSLVSKNRKKRSFFDLLDYSFNGGRDKIERVVTREFLDRIEITKLEEIQKETSINIDHLFSDIHIIHNNHIISELNIQHIHLSIPFLKHLNIIENTFRDFQILLNDIEASQNNQYTLILQEFAYYSHLISNCIMKTPTCDFDNHNLFCRQQCFLHSSNKNLTIHFKKDIYTKQSLSHVQCFHSSLGETFQFEQNIFTKNNTHLTDIHNKDLNIPLFCLLSNNGLCRNFWSLSDNTPYILQCIDGIVFITGNLNYMTKQNVNVSLSYHPPTVIADDQFPININMAVLYKQDICKNPLRKFHKNFDIFQKNKDSLSFQLFGPTFIDTSFDQLIEHSSLNSSSFRTHLETVINKIKQIDASEIHDRLTSLSFIFYLILAVIILAILASLCCCPALLLSFIKMLMVKIMQIFKVVITFIYTHIRILFQLARNRIYKIYHPVTQTEAINGHPSAPSSTTSNPPPYSSPLNSAPLYPPVQ